MRLRTTGVFTLLLLAGSVVGSSPLRAAEGIIDSFQNAVNTQFPPGVIQPTVGTTSATDTGVAGVIGGVRTLTVEATEIDIPSIDDVRAGAGFLGAFFEYRSTLGADGRATLLYDAGGAGLNAHFMSNQRLEVHVLDADTAATPYDVTITLVDTAARTTSVTRTVTAAGPQVVLFPLLEFGAVNVTAIRSISLNVDPSKAGDVRFRLFRIFTPPAAVPMLSAKACAALVATLLVIGVWAVRRARAAVSGPAA